MIKAYSQSRLDNAETISFANIWQKTGLINNSQLENIKSAFSSLYFSPNIFVRIGLFLFTLFLSFSVIGLASLFLFVGMSWEEGSRIGIILLIYGILHFFVLEVLIRNRNLYKAGIDDALLFMGVSLLIIGLILTFKLYNSPVRSSLISLPLLGIAMIRYADRVLTCFFYTSMLSLVFYGFVDSTALHNFLPFIFMAVSAGIYFVINRLAGEEFRYWKKCISMLKVLSLLTFYLSGNLFVIDKLNQFLNGSLTGALKIIFLSFTLLIPLLYIYRGLLKKDRMVLIVGMIILAGGVLTFKYYYSIASPEMSLSIAGSALTLIAYACMRYLREPRSGFTFNSVNGKEEDSDLEGLVIGESFAGASVSIDSGGTEFGGGSFGGAGGGGAY